MALDSIIAVALLISLLVFFMHSRYYEYRDLRFLFTAFTILTVLSIINAATVTGLIFDISQVPLVAVLTHGLGSLAAWFFAWDAYSLMRTPK